MAKYALSFSWPQRLRARPAAHCPCSTCSPATGVAPRAQAEERRSLLPGQQSSGGCGRLRPQGRQDKVLCYFRCSKTVTAFRKIGGREDEGEGRRGTREKGRTVCSSTESPTNLCAKQELGLELGLGKAANAGRAASLHHRCSAAGTTLHLPPTSLLHPQ